VANATSRPLYPRERSPVPIIQEAGGLLKKMFGYFRINELLPCGSRGDIYEDYCLLGRDAVQSGRNLPTFRRNPLPLFSG
jgi:hypothetical protein